MPDICTIREAVNKTREDGIYISEYALRRLIKTREIDVRYVGRKALVYYPVLEAYLRFGERCEK